MLLVHRRGLGRAVHLARGEEDEALDRSLANRVEQDLRALDVGRHEFARALFDRLLDVRLGGCVDDHVHLGDDVAHELGVADVTVHEREPLVRHRAVEVVDIPGVGERVEGHHLVRRLRQQVVDEVGRDEPRPSGDEDALGHGRKTTGLSRRPFGGGGELSLPRPRSMARDFQSTPVRVVIVDDHRLFVDALALLLGHDDRLTVIGTAGDGRTAIELAVSEQAEVAVIDVRMPEIDGLETARRLRKRSPETRVILVTGLDEPQLADQAREAGAVALLTKGALHDELKEAILAAAR